MGRPGTDRIKIPVEQLVEEPKTCNGHDRFSHPFWVKKAPKLFTVGDFDKSERKVEIELPDGKRLWTSISIIFGVVIAEVKDIMLLYPDEHTEPVSIVSIEEFKVKRTMYLKLIFERDLPF